MNGIRHQCNRTGKICEPPLEGYQQNIDANGVKPYFFLLGHHESSDPFRDEPRLSSGAKAPRFGYNFL